MRHVYSWLWCFDNWEIPSMRDPHVWYDYSCAFFFSSSAPLVPCLLMDLCGLSEPLVHFLLFIFSSNAIWSLNQCEICVLVLPMDCVTKNSFDSYILHESRWKFFAAPWNIFNVNIHSCFVSSREREVKQGYQMGVSFTSHLFTIQQFFMMVRT